MTEHGKRAQLLYDSRLYEQAERELHCAIAEDPHDAYAVALLSFVLGELKRMDESIESGMEAVALEPDTAYCYYALATAFFLSQRYDEASQTIGEAIRLDPEYAGVRRLASDIAYKQMQFEEALSQADKACELAPMDTNNLAARASALLALERFEEADIVLNSGLKISPENSGLFISKGRHALLQADHKSSIDFCQEALRLAPDSESSHYAMACALYDAGRSAEAEGYIRECIRLEPKDGLNYSLLAEILCVLKRPQEALDAARQGLMLSPDDYIAHSSLASILIKTSNFLEAETNLKKSLARWPNRITLHRWMIEVLCSLKRYTEAFAHAKACIEEFPQRPEAYRLQIFVLGKSRDWQGAETAAKDALERFPESPLLNEQAAALAYERGNHEDLLTYAVKCCALQPESVRFVHWHAIALMQLKRLDEADAVLDRALTFSSGLDDTHVNKGIIALERGDLEQSIRHCNQALAINPQSQIALSHLANAIKHRDPLYRTFYQWSLASMPVRGRAHRLFFAKPRNPGVWIVYIAMLPVFVCMLVLVLIARSLMDLYGNLQLLRDPVGRKTITTAQALRPLLIMVAPFVLIGLVVVVGTYGKLLFEIAVTILFAVVALLLVANMIRTKDFRSTTLFTLLVLIMVAFTYVWSWSKHLPGSATSSATSSTPAEATK